MCFPMFYSTVETKGFRDPTKISKIFFRDFNKKQAKTKNKKRFSVDWVRTKCWHRDMFGEKGF